MKKILVIYFSASGVTKNTAIRLKNLLNSDIFEIEPLEPYTDEDLNWMNKNSRSSLEMKDLSSRPTIKNKVNDFNSYDVIFVGFPIWWYVAPTIINTFLESYDLTGKVIVLFATSGGSGIKKAKDSLEKLYKDKATFKEGLLIKRTTSDQEILECVHKSLN